MALVLIGRINGLVYFLSSVNMHLELSNSHGKIILRMNDYKTMWSVELAFTAEGSTASKIQPGSMEVITTEAHATFTVW